MTQRQHPAAPGNGRSAVDGALIAAIGMMLVLEGIIPFFSPKLWRDTFSRIARLSDGQIRFFGLIALMFGALLLGAAGLFS
jgi:uncharacterized protein YjeT (DUF2065 family)